MQPASLVISREGNVITATATTMLAGRVFFHWYVDGAFVETTLAGSYSLTLEEGERVRISVIDTNSESFDPVANAPEGFPGRRTIRWVRATYPTAAAYDVYQQKGAGASEVIGRIAHDDRRWSYSFRTGVLDDLATYYWYVLTILDDGNEGNTKSIYPVGGEKIVRTPDAPQFTMTLDEGTGKVTFAEAA
jgi:plasmid stabilization system protein ParE